MAKKPVILVAVDGSDQSLKTVTYLAGMLSSRQIGIELFHVKTKVPEAVFDLGSPEDTIDADTVEYEAEITRWTRRNGSAINAFMETAKQRFMAAGFPADSISIIIQDRQIGVARDIVNRARLGCAAVVGRPQRVRLPSRLYAGQYRGQTGREHFPRSPGGCRHTAGYAQGPGGFRSVAQHPQGA